MVFSAHLSVRCEAKKRRDEIAALIQNSTDMAAHPVIIAGESVCGVGQQGKAYASFDATLLSSS